MVKTRKVKKNFDQVLIGDEPKIEEITGRNDYQLTKALNWYSYMHDEKQAHKWLVMWMKENKFPRDEIIVVRDAPEWAAGTASGWVARMSMNGTKFAPSNIQYVKDRIKYIIDKFSVPEQADEEVVENKINIQDRVKAKNKQLLCQAEGEVLDAWIERDPEAISMYDFLVKYQATQSAANAIKDFYQAQHDEVFIDDPDIKECFGKDLKRTQEFWTNVFDDLDRYLNNKKVVKVRKPKTIKVKPVSKIVENVKYQEAFPELKLVSANPQQLVGAKQVWTYNTKSRILAVYNAADDKGISVKGTTLTNYNETESTGKRLRKPEVVLNQVLTAGKVSLRKILSELTTVDININGRINKDTILLRVVS